LQKQRAQSYDEEKSNCFISMYLYIVSHSEGVSVYKRGTFEHHTIGRNTCVYYIKEKEGEHLKSWESIGGVE